MNRTSAKTTPIQINDPNITAAGIEQALIQIGYQVLKWKILNKPGRGKNLVSLSVPLSRELSMPPNCLLHYRLVKAYPLQIRLGPVVGVLTTVHRDRYSGLPIGKEAQYYKEMIAYGRQRGVFIYLFYLPDINWARKTIAGYTISFPKTKAERWKKQDFPFPDIIYNRIRYRHLENSAGTLEVLNRFNQYPDAHIFNSRFLNKWEVYQALEKNPLLVPFLPPTVPFNRGNLKLFLRNYTEVFLKPADSSRGKGIIKIRKTSAYYQYALANPSEPQWKDCPTEEELLQALSPLMVDENRYLIQMGIKLARLNRKVFDVRAQVQKNGEGKWTLTGMAVRKAARGQFLTHIPNGGTGIPYQKVINQVFGSSPQILASLNDQINLITTEMPLTLERLLELSLAVLSVDIGIDQGGRMWVIEVNSKPSSFDEPNIRKKHLQYLMDYCIYFFGL